MSLDLRDLLRTELRVHSRLKQQGLLARPDEGARLAATLPPLVPFGNAQYAAADWLVDWDHRLPSRQAVLRLYAHYTDERRREAQRALDDRLAEIAKADLFPEFDVPDFVGLPADEAYETEIDLSGNPSRLRLISDWRREIQQAPGEQAVEIVRDVGAVPRAARQGQDPSGRARRSRAGGVVAAVRDRSRALGRRRLVPADVQRHGRRGARVSRRSRRARRRARARLPVPRRLDQRCRWHSGLLPRVSSAAEPRAGSGTKSRAGCGPRASRT